LDVSTGVGGLPRGRFTEIYGPEGSGKTTIALTMAKNVTLAGGKVLYIDAEIMLSYEAIESMLGFTFDKEKFILIQPETGEQAFMIIEQALKTGDFELIVVDTVAALECSSSLSQSS
jgi:recombination protein RecA